MSEIEDRRQRAREAGQDCWSTLPERRMDVAIEIATRVQITPETMRAAERENVHGAVSVEAVRAAFEAAGFEVVE